MDNESESKIVFFDYKILLNKTWQDIFNKNRKTIAQENLRFCHTASAIMLFVLALFVGIYAVVGDYHLYPAFFVTAALFCVMFFAARYALLHPTSGYRTGEILPYVFSAVAMLFSAYTIYFGGANIISYVAFMILLTIMIIDQPTQKFIFVFLSAALFFLLCITSDWGIRVQENYDINFNLFAIGAYLCGVFICWRRVQAFDAARKLGKLSAEDAGTGLKNRRSLFEDLEKLDAEERITGIIMCDIDGFKKFNDTYGHQIGDKCIETVGHVLNAYGRDNNYQFYRYGGDEFSGIMLTDSKIPIEICARDIAQMVNAVDIRVPSGETINISISVGYALKQRGEDYNDCLKYADYKMYQVKQQMLMRRMAEEHLELK